MDAVSVGEKPLQTSADEVMKPAPREEAAADGDVENPPVTASTTNFTVTSVVRRWEREDLLMKTMMVLRAATCFFSFFSLVVMATNKHGDWKDYDKYQEYRYCLAVGILAFLYTMGQVGRQVHRINTGKDSIAREAAGFVIDFTGDQILAYLLISALSAAIPITNRMREGADNMFTDASSTAISMAFFAFVALALSSLVSGFKLAHRTYI